MNGLNLALSALGILAGLLVTAAAVVAFFRANLAKSTIDTLRDSNTALTARVAELEAENGRQAVKLQHLEEEAVALRSYVSGTDAVRELEAKVDRYQQILQQGLNENRAVMVARLDLIADKVGARGSAA